MNTTGLVMTVTDELLAELEEITIRQPGALLSVRSSSMNLIYSELRRLRAENAELANDADRYRWLRNQSMEYRQNGPAAIMAEVSGEKGTFLELDDLDTAIDTAMAAQ